MPLPRHNLSIIPPASNALSVFYNTSPIPSWYFRITIPKIIISVTAQPQATPCICFGNTQITSRVRNPTNDTVAQPKRVDSKFFAWRFWIIVAIVLVIVGSPSWVLNKKYLPGRWGHWNVKSDSRDNVIYIAAESNPSTQDMLMDEFERAMEEHVEELFACPEPDVKSLKENKISASCVIEPHLDGFSKLTVVFFTDWLERNEDVIQRLALPTDNSLLDTINRNMFFLLIFYFAYCRNLRVNDKATNASRVDAAPKPTKALTATSINPIFYNSNNVSISHTTSRIEAPIELHRTDEVENAVLGEASSDSTPAIAAGAA
ncbi:hypothetical protein DXG03_001536, partial [Asterophora parasitica]